MDQVEARRVSGFTLIELMITLTVLGTGLLAMLVLQTQALADGARGNHNTGAAMVASKAMPQRNDFIVLIPCPGPRS